VSLGSKSRRPVALRKSYFTLWVFSAADDGGSNHKPQACEGFIRREWLRKCCCSAAVALSERGSASIKWQASIPAQYFLAELFPLLLPATFSLYTILCVFHALQLSYLCRSVQLLQLARKRWMQDQLEGIDGDEK
jgi:hypothetical protein